MDTEIQKNDATTANMERATTYVSWKGALLNSFGAVFTILALLALFAAASSSPESAGMFVAYLVVPPFIILLPILLVLFLLASLFGKSKGYIQVWLADIMFIIPTSIVTFLSWAISRNDLLASIKEVGYLLVPMFAVVGMAIYLNHKKFQKTMAEWATTKLKSTNK